MAARPWPLLLLLLLAGPGRGPGGSSGRLRLGLGPGPAAGYFPEERWNPESPLRPPRVAVALLARNAAHSLPLVLGGLERLRHPKDRMALWVAADHSVDNTSALLAEWLGRVRGRYHRVLWRHQEEPTSFPDEEGPKHWSPARYEHVMRLRQEALEAARAMWADYLLFLDADNVLVNPDTLAVLVAENRTVVAPMLDSRAAYSNFWCGITPQGYYRRTPAYLPIRRRERRGCFAVPMVHSTFLLDLRRERSQSLAFHPPPPGYSGAFDDIIVFAAACRHAGVQMFVSNREQFGFLPVPLRSQSSLRDEAENFLHVQLEIMVKLPPAEPSPHVWVPPKVLDKLGFDEVFLINLRRRSGRRARMLRSLHALGVSPRLVEAVDGRALNRSQVEALGVRMLLGYRDPFHGRPLTHGEVGCFLSHFRVWQEISARGLQRSLVFEDDLRFEVFFRSRLTELMEQLDEAAIDWDLIYLGRKRLEPERSERGVPGVRQLLRPGYSYWSLGYALSLRGARKLLAAEPLGKMIPVDEFLPLMFDRHPSPEYSRHFSRRDLLAFSAEPLLLFPTHYTGEPGYVSDTETPPEPPGAGPEFPRESRSSQPPSAPEPPEIWDGEEFLQEPRNSQPRHDSDARDEL
ncbi:procollagen galactosyltransferase 1-like isoform X1 [Pyrgilauda ruficollis]|uniref:procollagen galactosyltransferase 1-like isoform X1 n=2 Tax=Pyrgilauda ruficollis TaxID=221976 RepID=UPI001B85BC29|nr:procollagen galactosyltransferase 1-like isoform X1 [Pyrgilauda ruficollis]